MLIDPHQLVPIGDGEDTCRYMADKRASALHGSHHVKKTDT